MHDVIWFWSLKLDLRYLLDEDTVAVNSLVYISPLSVCAFSFSTAYRFSDRPACRCTDCVHVSSLVTNHNSIHFEKTPPACTAGWLVFKSELLLLQAKDLPREELIPVLQLLLSPATSALEGNCKQHHQWLRKLAVTAVESAESACLAHIRTEGELTSVDEALQERVAKAAYAAAAVDQMTAQVHSPYLILSLGVVTGALPCGVLIGFVHVVGAALGVVIGALLCCVAIGSYHTCKSTALHSEPNLCRCCCGACVTL